MPRHDEQGPCTRRKVEKTPLEDQACPWISISDTQHMKIQKAIMNTFNFKMEEHTSWNFLLENYFAMKCKDI